MKRGRFTEEQIIGILNAEIDDHLSGESTEGRFNHRNGYSKKSVLEEVAE
ncbi:MAG: hypothetical protein QF449_12945 [Alphaproteobacteria bacterium]|jgi:putative transposase|nr:hypothetical protein [Alphaproteobacteria bacterium]MDP6818936.1 hypothetical protein [Alphaproteobacteria bacterium]|tara:strand:+ start:138 stop:287 length:150 start_codon:yes stop_codon:yes gene_type:complete